ncbi:unnamed protein product, partial [Didymodactylos carnosus]
LEETFLLQSTESIIEICKIMAIENILLNFIPVDIKCENYVHLSISLIKQRSKLQELMINIEEKFYKTNQINLWSEKFIITQNIPEEEEEQQQPKTNRFAQFLTNNDDSNHLELDHSLTTFPKTSIEQIQNTTIASIQSQKWDLNNPVDDQHILVEHTSMNTVTSVNEIIDDDVIQMKPIDGSLFRSMKGELFNPTHTYTALFTINIKMIKYPLEMRQKETVDIPLKSGKPSKFIIRLPD